MGNELDVHILFRGERKEYLSQEDDYLKEFRNNLLIAATVPILEFNYKNLEELSNILNNNTDKINGIIISSPRVVEALNKALNLLNKNDKSRICNKLEKNLVFVIGQKTAEDCLEKLPFNYNLESSKTGDSNSLADYIFEYCSKNFSNREVNLLYPKSSLSDNVIELFLSRSKEIKVNSLIVYETNVIENITEEIIDKLDEIFNENDKTIINLTINLVFFSPSGVRGFLNEREFFYKKLKLTFPNVSIETKYSSIGKTTEAELLKNNIEVFCVSDKPNPSSLVNSIIGCLRERQ